MVNKYTRKNPRIYNGEKTISSTNGFGKLACHMQKNKTGPYLIPYTEINSKWIKDSNVRPESIKLLKENIGNMLSETDLSNIFILDLSPQTRATGKQMWLHQTQKSCRAKETLNKTKRQLSEWKKPFGNDTSDKELISKIYEELIQLNRKKKIPI